MAAVSSDPTGPGAGYDALTAGAGLHRATDRRVLRVSGDRAPDMLQGLISADIRDPGPEERAAWPSLVLDPKGKVLADALVLRAGDVLLLDVPASAWPDLEPHLGRYLPPRFARLEPSGLEAWRLRGPRALEAAAALDPALAGLAAPRRTGKAGARFDAMSVGGGFAVRRDDRGGDGIDLYLAAGGPPDGWDVATVSDPDWEAWRVERGIPLYGRDVTAANLPQETGLVDDATSFEKGCYTGQEVLARIHYRGKVNRRLMALVPPDENTPMPASGDELRDGERVVGSITSVAPSRRHGWAALGYVRREVEAGATLDVAAAGAIAVSRATATEAGRRP